MFFVCFEKVHPTLSITRLQYTYEPIEYKGDGLSSRVFDRISTPCRIMTILHPSVVHAPFGVPPQHLAFYKSHSIRKHTRLEWYWWMFSRKYLLAASDLQYIKYIFMDNITYMMVTFRSSVSSTYVMPCVISGSSSIRSTCATNWICDHHVWCKHMLVFNEIDGMDRRITYICWPVWPAPNWLRL